MSLTRTIFAMALMLMVLPNIAAQANETLEVFKSQAKVYRVARPAGTIIVGNPDVVTATVEDLQTVVLTGREFGTTNIIVLDEDGQPLIDKVVVVVQNEMGQVRVFTPSGQTRLACESTCSEY